MPRLKRAAGEPLLLRLSVDAELPRSDRIGHARILKGERLVPVAAKREFIYGLSYALSDF